MTRHAPDTASDKQPPRAAVEPAPLVDLTPPPRARPAHEARPRVDADRTPTTPLPRQPRHQQGPLRIPASESATERLPLGHLCGFTGELPATGADTDDEPGLSHDGFARLLLVGGLLGLVVAVLRSAENASVVDVVPLCGAGQSAICEPVRSTWSPLTSLLGVAGFAVLAAVGAVMASGVRLPRSLGRGLLVVVAAGVVTAHVTAFQSLFAEGTLCYSCLLACLIAIPILMYTVLHAQANGWIVPSRGLRPSARFVGEHHRLIVAGWYLTMVGLALLTNASVPADPARDEAFGAAALISSATMVGAWLASRYADRIGLWLSVASALMMVTALTDIVPDVWHESEEAGTPLWIPAAALAAGFLVVAYFTRGGCGHGHDESGEHHDHEEEPAHDHLGEQAMDQGGRLTTPEPSADQDRSASSGGVGAAAALTVHRVIEGATLALTPSVAVIGALFVHSASEGLALGALFSQTRQRLLPWLMLSAAGPAIGVVVASVSPIPDTVAPVLLALVGGVLMRTAWVGITLVAAERRDGRLRPWHVIAAVLAAGALAALTITSH